MEAWELKVNQKNSKISLTSQDLSSEEPAWQMKRRSIAERNMALFNNSYMSNVTFLVGNEEPQSIPAHKYVLSIGSPVFHTMFYGELAKAQDSSSSSDLPPICVPDIEPLAFLSMLKYLYFDAVDLTMNTVFSVLYASKKYMIPFLTEECILLLQRHLSPQNACFFLSKTRIFEEKDFITQCWNLIDTNPHTALASESFPEIDPSTLADIISRDDFKCREVNIFKAALCWANARLSATCSEESKGEKRRELLGSVLKFIRFPLMTNIEFADEVVPSGILYPNEITDMFMHISSTKAKPKTEYNSLPRRGFIQAMQPGFLYSSSDQQPLQRAKFEEERRQDLNRFWTKAKINPW